ncbi:hypothetical protein SAMD00024442_3_26 [Candidatus Symbiothrix dinenymphae]|nr:hypothetical protein SAMD00024442_3_26 [Candidatus Symbiothrix dinenymphae]
MKKIMVFMAVAVLATVSASAKGRSFGVTAGLNISSVDIKEADGLDSKMGFLVGGVIDHDLSNAFSIISELTFSQKGWIEDRGEEHAVTLNYLQLSPANVTYKIPLPANSKVFIFLGPYFSYLFSASYKQGSDSGDIPIDTDDYNSLDPIDFGLNLGAGYQFGKIYGKIQSNLGLFNIASGDSYFHHIKISNIGISVGYLF